VTITLNHTIVLAVDHQETARFFATVVGLECLPPAGSHGRSDRPRGLFFTDAARNLYEVMSPA
jgi:hypothetical protein